MSQQDVSRGATPDPTFGARLRRLREAAGLSQTALAGDQVHPSYVSLLEAGRRVPTDDVVRALAERLRITPGQLTGEDNADLEEPVVLAEAALGLGREREARELLAPWVERFTLERVTSDPLVFRACQAYAAALERGTDLAAAAAYYETLRTAAEHAPARHPWLPVVIALMRCYRDSGDIARAVDLGEGALARCQNLPAPQLSSHAALVSTLAGAYAERGDLLRAQLLLDDLVAETDESGSVADRTAAYWNAAISAAERGRPADGLRLAEQAKALAELGDNLGSRAGIAFSQAWVHLAMTPPQPEAARALLREAMPTLRQYNGTVTVAAAETELARCELLLGRPDVARRHAQSALKRLGPDNRVERARALTALGAALVALGERTLGVASLEDAATALGDVGAVRQAAAVWRQLSAVFRGMGEVERALDAADRALDAAGLLAEPIAAPAAPTRTRSRRRTGTPA